MMILPKANDKEWLTLMRETIGILAGERRARNQVTDELKAQAIALRSKGTRIQEIVETLEHKVKYQTVYSWVRHLNVRNVKR